VARYPALDVRGADGEIVLAVVDNCSPTAVEDRGDSVRIFFPDAARRDLARRTLALEMPAAVTAAREVDDEDWARRSQENLAPVTVGRLTITAAPPHARTDVERPGLTLVIQPSMGFGTGHHATTRLCLAALQTLNLEGSVVVDLGTGSGVLAIAARRLGARSALGLDTDADAIRAATENLRLNGGVSGVSFEVRDLLPWLACPDPPRPDVVTANLTGAMLGRAAPALAALVHGDARLIVSGVLQSERDEVAAAFRALDLVWESKEDGWVGLLFAARRA